MISSETVIAVAGLIATACSSAISYYFAQRARTEPYREHLYLRQVETVEMVLDRASELYMLLGELTGDHPDISAHDQIWHRASAVFEQFSALSSRVMACLPTGLLDQYSTLSNLGTHLLVDLAKEYLTTAVLADFEVGLEGFAAASREFLGVDPLSEESRGLFNSWRAAERSVAKSKLRLRVPRPNP
jgi:hypothetical protein